MTFKRYQRGCSYLVSLRRLAAVMLLVLPLVAVGGAIQLKIMAGFQGDGLKCVAGYVIGYSKTFFKNVAC